MQRIYVVALFSHMLNVSRPLFHERALRLTAIFCWVAGAQGYLPFGGGCLASEAVEKG